MVTSPPRRAVAARSQLRSAQPGVVSHPAMAGWAPLSLPQSSLFGTDGIRGQVGELLNAPLALQVGFWAGQVLQSHAQRTGVVLIGQDSRNSSDMLSAALSAGLTASGLEVWNLGLCATPCVATLTPQLNALGGVMISASHNPPQDNGIKFFAADGTKLSTVLQKEIEAALRGNLSPIASALPEAGLNPWGRCEQRFDLVERYAQALHRSLPTGVDLSGMRIALDLAWGSATRSAIAVFESLGAEVIALHSTPDGNRINVHCGSTHLEPLKAAVKEHQADLGFAFDGDADRVMAVDAQGREVNGDYILYFWGNLLQSANQLPENLIVSTVMANLGFERAWQAQGGEFVRTPVGDQHVHAEMQRRGAMLGGEQSGHILCHHYSLTGDGVLTALHIAGLVQQSGTSLADLVDQSFQTYPQLLKNIRVEDRDRRLNWQDCDPLQQAIAQAESAMGDQGRVLVRASGTEPVIRVMVEAIDAAMTAHWTDLLSQTVQRHLAV